MNHRRFLWLGLFIAGSLAAAGCGSKVDVQPGGQGGSTSVSSPAAGTMTGSGTPCSTGNVLAMNRLLLGDTDRNGDPNLENAWKQYGLNLNGLISTTDSIGLCKPAAGGSPSAVYPDGDNGIDNAFGKNIIPMLLGLAPDISVQANDAILNGEFTLILEIDAPGNCTASSKLYEGAPLGSPPQFDGMDVWPVSPDSLQNPNDIESVKNVFLQHTIISDFYRSGPEASFALKVIINHDPATGIPVDVSMRLPISHGRLEMQLDPAHTEATFGTIAGIIETEALVSEIAQAAAAFDTIFCDPNSVQNIVNLVRQASDIMKDGTQDPSATCDGISIGLGFDMRQVQLGPISPVAPPPPDPCGPNP